MADLYQDRGSGTSTSAPGAAPEQDIRSGTSSSTSSFNPGMSGSTSQSPGTSSPSARQSSASSSSSASASTDLMDKAKEDFQQVREMAETHAHSAIDKSAEFANEQKNVVARQLGGVASALQKVGEELEKSDNQTIGHYARDLGRSAKGLADSIKDRDLGEVASLAEDFGRRQPVAFLGLAALAGFAASRFVTASASRRPSQTTGASTYGGSSHGTTPYGSADRSSSSSPAATATSSYQSGSTSPSAVSTQSEDRFNG